ncbi:30S ribosomal protein S4 [Rickettsiales bacterium]|nr:30S ribosomal protein S4 [Rickettsiales bacterium]
MSKRQKRKFATSRSLGVNLWGRAKDPVEVRNYAPGQHGPNGRRGMASDYKKQLQAKQKLRKYYGDITEKQFRRIFKEAERMRGDTGENLVGLLESRLDAFIYRTGFVPTIFAARQFVNHNHVKVNGKKANIASYRLKEGDVIEVKEKSREIPMVLESIQNPDREVPEYVDADPKKMTAKFVRTPGLTDIPYPVLMEPHLIIEFYSR